MAVRGEETVERRVSLTEEDVLKAWVEALDLKEVVDEPNALTFKELCEKLHCGKDRMRNLLNNAVENGTVKKVLVIREGRDSRPYPVQAYILSDIEKQ